MNSSPMVDETVVIPTLDAPLVLAVTYLVGASAGAFVLWFLAVGSVGGELAGLAAGIIPVAAALSAAPFGRTAADGGLVAGTLLVAAGLVGGLRAGRPRSRAPAPARPARAPDLLATPPAPPPASRPPPPPSPLITRS